MTDLPPPPPRARPDTWVPPPPGAELGDAGPPVNSLAVASLVLAVLVPGVGSLLAVVLGHISLHQIGRGKGRPHHRGLAIAGLLFGYGGLATAALAYFALAGLSESAWP